MIKSEAQCLQTALATSHSAQENEQKWNRAADDPEDDGFCLCRFDVLQAHLAMQQFHDECGDDHPQAQAADHDEEEWPDWLVGREALRSRNRVRVKGA